MTVIMCGNRGTPFPFCKFSSQKFLKELRGKERQKALGLRVGKETGLQFRHFGYNAPAFAQKLQPAQL
jgi:hypothetical protein